MLLEPGTRVRDPSPLTELRGITKRFPGIIACDRVDLPMYAGEIHALLGENGAGKTTLMHVLYGLHQPDAGEIWVDGQPRVVHSPKDAIRAGIGMVFQHFTLIPSLTVAANIALAASSSHVFLRRKWLAARVQELGEQYQLAVDPNSHVWQLSVGEQQRVEILKLLYRRARILILDEPTAVLTPKESEAFLQTMRKLAAAGHAVILITHKLAEALSVAHRITVLRHGWVVANPDPAEVTKSDLARWMIERDLPIPPTRPSQAAAAVELSLTLEKRSDPSPRLRYVLPAVAIGIALLLGAIVLSFMGAHPGEAYQEMARSAFDSVYGLSETLVKATPLLLAGLGVGVAFRAGF